MTDTLRPIPAHLLPHRSPTQLLDMARRSLTDATTSRPDGLRYASAHLAALRAAAAILAARTTPTRGDRRQTASAWTLLATAAPELSEWATFFADTSSKRAAAEAGIPRQVTAREADDMCDAAGRFVAVVEMTLGLTPTAPAVSRR